MMLDVLKNLVKFVSNIHIPGNRPDVFVFATPRGGSTWFMELICSQKGFRYCSEPLDIRNRQVRYYSGINTWSELYEPETSLKYKKYFTNIIDGRISFRNPNPFRKYYRPITNRMVFKLIHGGVDRVNWFRNEFEAKVLLCLRHPIPVSISRVEYPFLEKFLDSQYRQQFTASQLQLTSEVLRSGTKLQKGMVAWCIHNSAPLRDVEDDWAVVTYEQAVVEPEPVIEYLCKKLELSEPDRIYNQLSIPSKSVTLSDAETQEMLKKGTDENDRDALVKKWRKRVTDDEISSAQEILDIFDIRAYRADQFLPTDAFWIGRKSSSLNASIHTDIQC